MIILTGDSHTNALRLGAQELSQQGEIPASIELRVGMLGNGKHADSDFSETRDGRVVLTQPALAGGLRRLTGDDAFRAEPQFRYGVCLGFHSAPFFRHPMWRRYRPAPLFTQAAGQRPVSSGVLDTIVDARGQFLFKFFDRLLSTGVDFFVIAAPPPRRDHPCLKESPANVVLAADRIFRHRVSQRLDSLGIRYVMPPESTTDDAGFLKSEYANIAPRDFHHGNAAYGAEMLRSVLEVAQDPR